MVCPRTDDAPQPIFTARRYRKVWFFSRQYFTARSYDVLLVIRKTRFGPDLSQPTVCTHPLNVIILQSYDSDRRNVTKSRQCYGELTSYHRAWYLGSGDTRGVQLPGGAASWFGQLPPSACAANSLVWMLTGEMFSLQLDRRRSLAIMGTVNRSPPRSDTMAGTLRAKTNRT